MSLNPKYPATVFHNNMKIHVLTNKTEITKHTKPIISKINSVFFLFNYTTPPLKSMFYYFKEPSIYTLKFVCL